MDLLTVFSDEFVVCRDHLLSYVEVNDLLRLRRVCRSLKYLTEDYIRLRKIKTNRHLITSFAKIDPLEEHLKFQENSSVLPFRVSLLFKRWEQKRTTVSMDILFQHFLNNCVTSNITVLLIEGFVVRQKKKLTQLFNESFPNLLQLELLGILALENDFEEEEEDAFDKEEEPTFGKGFKKLHYLKLSLGAAMEISSFQLQQNVFDFCVQIVETCIPTLFNLCILDLWAFEWVLGISSERLMQFACSSLFGQDNSVVLQSMDGVFIEKMLQENDRTLEMGTVEEMRRRINAKVVSIDNPESMCFHLELPGLEQIIFTDTTECRMPAQGFIREHEWPRLEEMRVRFTNVAEFQNVLDGQWLPSLERLWDFLFVGITRNCVRTLEIGFNYRTDEEQDEQEEEEEEEEDDEMIIPTFPRNLDIVRSCPNLKVLHLDQKIKKLVVLPELWKGLPQLEKLRFRKAEGVNNEDFIGEDENAPAFLNLKRLQMLEFFFFEHMDVNDDLFSKVLCHMPLQKLYITSDAALKSVTLEGIERLKEGVFGSTVEKLVLQLQGFDEEEQLRVKKLFRSFQMI